MKFSILALLLMAAPAFAQHGNADARPPRQYQTTPIPTTEVGGWRADLQQVVRDLERLHPNPYNKTDRATFAAAAARLDQRIPQLAAHEIIVEFERLIALVGDGHTNLNLAANQGVDFHQLPIRFGIYADGIWVEAADRAYADAVGGKVISFGNVPAATALERITPIISRDNDNWIAVAAPHLLNLIEVLHAFRLTDQLERASITVEKGGARRTIELRPLAQTRPRPFGYPFLPRYTEDWVDARDASRPLPLFQQRLEDLYWWEHLPEQRLLYIKWDQVQNRAIGESALQMFTRAMEFARQNAASIDKVLLDIRNNTGGEGGLLDPIVREIVRTREVDQPGKFFVAIGSRTFSAGLLLSSALERYARPIFVGEPTSGKPNVHAGHVFTTLHNSGIGVSISPAFYQSGIGPTDARPHIVPRLYVRPTFADYQANRDPVLETVIAYKGETLTAELRPLIERGDTMEAAARLRAHASDPINRFNGAAGTANSLGYSFMRGGDMTRALLTFRLNVRVHPDYTNGWDSLGEAYMQAGRVAEAIAAFEEVLKREPANGRAREYLARLRARA